MLRPITFQILNSAASEPNSIQSILKLYKGIKWVFTNPEGQSAAVAFDPRQIDENKIMNALSKVGIQVYY